ncbi:DUF499 domain-containing protein [Ferrimicrobium sp.]|uniref:DUF499 domain-containing protein n=1 Tax=Ferrimicrobium sp. TaxID=2926050 RepID=UPI002626BA60|nr:DUF499 domain-containing protein [Ferrimicrobium sp.]
MCFDRDVDSERATSLQLDNEVPGLGRYQAARRVMRTLFLDTAPVGNQASRGIDEGAARLGCVMPGESPRFVDDALRRLVERSTYLNEDQGRYWLDVQPTVTQLAAERSERIRQDLDALHAELAKRMRRVLQHSSAQLRAHSFPSDPADVADEPTTRLVIIGPEHPWKKPNGEPSPAIAFANEVLASRGGSVPRRYRNTLIFLAPDENRLNDLLDNVARYLAWESVIKDKDDLDLSPNRVRQCERQMGNASDRVNAQINETFAKLIFPVQPDPTSPLVMRELSLSVATSENLLDKAEGRLRREDVIIPVLGHSILRAKLDEIPLWPEGSITVSQLIEYFASYLYLPRVMGPTVLLRCIESGVNQLMWREDSFAYAESYDEIHERYIGLKAGEGISLVEGDPGMLVRPDLIVDQLEADRQRAGDQGISALHEQELAPESVVIPRAPQRPKRYHARAELDPLRATDASRIYNEVISHLTGSISRGGSGEGLSRDRSCRR